MSIFYFPVIGRSRLTTFPSVEPEAGFFWRSMKDQAEIKGVIYGVAIAVSIWLLAWILGS